MIYSEFQQVDPPAQLIYTWSDSIAPGDPTLVILELREHSEGTDLVLTHSRFAAEPIRDMHLQGWNACIDKLEEFLAGDVKPRPTAIRSAVRTMS